MARTPYKAATEQGVNHPDFKNAPWVQSLLQDPDLQIQKEATAADDNAATNAFWNSTLSHETGMRARISFTRPCHEPDSVSKLERCYLISIGTDIDGATGRAHGGFSAVLLDHVTGWCARSENRDEFNSAPATATMTVDYKAPVGTPGIVLCRSWPVEISGRKVWAKGVVEDGEGKTLAAAKALFVNPRLERKASL